jgi:hypothetical protein
MNYRLGLTAPPMKEQIPSLDQDDADQFDKDVQAIYRLKLREIITESESRKACDRLAKAINRAS